MEWVELFFGLFVVWQVVSKVLLTGWIVRRFRQFLAKRAERQAEARAADIFHKELLERSGKLQDEIDIVASTPVSLEVLLDMLGQAETFNNFVIETLSQNSRRPHFVFCGHLEARIAAIRNLRRKELGSSSP